MPATLPPLRRALDIAREQGLDLWLDAACWHGKGSTLQAAYALRLLALCQALNVRLTWWGHGAQGGLLDEHLDPTALFYAVQAWHSIVDGGPGKLILDAGTNRLLRWRDAAGRSYAAWWRVDDAVGTIGESTLALPAGALIADPLYARLLRPTESLPLSAWPIISRSK